MTSEEHKTFDEKIIQTATSLVSFRHADIILLYAPIKSEIDVMPIFELAKEKGKKVAFPRCNAEDHSMVFHYTESKEDFESGAYGLFEPYAHLPSFDPEASGQKNVLCVVPAVVYDRRGYRVGYGGGYYDRFFGKFRPASIGVIYEEFILRSVPHGRFDISVDVVVSERGIYACK
jgi:5-formyltetrahydrofolate cyclo-ligase